MATSERFGAVKTDIAKAKQYIRYSKGSGGGSISRSYFKETHCSVENAEIESRGLYCFEKLIRLAFIQSMKDDAVFGRQQEFIDYITGLNNNFEGPLVADWRVEQSAMRASNFMISFYNIYSYQWKKHGRSIDKSLPCFLSVLRDCLDFSYMKLNEKFDILPEEVKSNIDKAFFLTNDKIGKWYEEREAEISAA